MTKAKLRKTIKAALASLPLWRFREAGIEAARSLPELPLWENSRSILIFVSLPGEIDTAPLMERALKAGKQVFAPKTEGKILTFYRIFGLKDVETFVDSKTIPGLREPAAPLAAPRLGSDDFPALIITPGLAFDLSGGRLGRGKGFYDRFFASIEGREYKALGLCLKDQIVDKVPADSFDKAMDMVCPM